MVIKAKARALANKIKSKEAVIAVIGMGYVGLSLLEVFGREGYPIVGLDCDAEKVEDLKRGKSTMGFLPLDDLFPLIDHGKFIPTTDASILKDVDIVVICAPTGLDSEGQPDLVPLRAVFQEVVNNIQEGQLIILQSTTYPGTTVEELLPKIREKMCIGEEVCVGYVPEISDIGNPNHTFCSVPRILAGISPACTEMIKLLYETIGCQTYICPSTQVAEAAKIYQNAYRLINVSFVNEMKVLFDRMGIDIWDVIDAASTKPFGFTRFEPGTGAGGGCIPIDPLYLTWKSGMHGCPTQMIDIARNINEMLPHYVVDKVVEALGKQGKAIKGTKLLQLGVAFKRDVDDPRYSASVKVLELLLHEGADVHYNDPFVPYLKQLDLNSVPLERLDQYDGVVIATDHTQYEWDKILEQSNLIIDTRNVVHGKKVVRA